jgi:hypothetical protein
VSILVDYVMSLFTPSAPGARRLGYVGESFAIRARQRRHSTAWAPHQAETQRFLSDLPVVGARLVVLGSGPLLDVPLEALAQRWPEVVLVDVVHARPARTRASALPNVRCVTLDLTGCLSALDEGRGVPTPRPPALPQAEGATVVSLNLLSQLPILPLERLASLRVDAEAGEAFARALVAGHVRWLRGLGAVRAALVSDTQRRWFTRGSEAVEVEDALHGVRLAGAPDRAWTWEVAPWGEIDAQTRLTLDVQAWFDVPAPD